MPFVIMNQSAIHLYEKIGFKDLELFPEVSSWEMEAIQILFYFIYSYKVVITSKISDNCP